MTFWKKKDENGFKNQSLLLEDKFDREDRLPVLNRYAVERFFFEDSFTKDRSSKDQTYAEIFSFEYV